MPLLTKPFDASFFLGLFFVVASVAMAAIAVSGHALPVIGTGRGALIAVGIIGMTGCAIAGVSQTVTSGWTHPVMILGSALGVVALVVIAAGIFGWDGIVRPIASRRAGGSSLRPLSRSHWSRSPP